ncbi:MAG: sugar-binding transcriptional regulator [Lactobacillus sp.]
MPKNSDKAALALQVSRLYYYDHVNQSEIARRVNLSRPTVAQLLKYAREHRIVEIKINDPFSNAEDLAAQLKSKYQLAQVKVAPDGPVETLLARLGQAGAQLLAANFRNGDTVGFSWGHTMAAVAQHLQRPARDLKLNFVSLKGSVSNSEDNNYADQIYQQLNETFNTQFRLLPLPVIFKSQMTRDIVAQDTFIKRIIEQAENAEIAVYTVGSEAQNSQLLHGGYFDAKQSAHLEKSIVGDLNSQFINAKGELADPELAKRTVALTPQQLRQKRLALLVAGGVHKLPVLKAALAGHDANALATDAATAQALLK